jgi:hypothetical protein
MRALVLLAIVSAAACYSPNLAPCTVRCASGDRCPDDMSCGGDHYCHPPGDTEVCPPSYFTVNVLTAGTGSGNVSGGGLDCGGLCDTAVASGTTVVLRAQADSGSRLSTWSGACAGTTASTCTLHVTSDTEVGITFNIAVPLSVAFIGVGSGTVTSDPTGIDCTADCTALFDLDSNITLTATPVDPSVLIGWGGACQGVGTCVVNMSDSMQVSVDFE